MDNLAPQSRWQLVHPHNVHPDTGQLCVGGESGGEAGQGGVERLGAVFGYGDVAGGVVVDGGVV